MSPASSAEFEALVAHHRREVFAVCRSVLRDEHLGADATQEAFVRLWKRMDTAGTPLELRGWLRRAAVSSAIDQLRRRRRENERGESLEELDESSAVADERFDPAQLTDGELADAFSRALGELSEGQRAIFLLRHEGGLTLAEIGETLGIARETVRTQFARAALRLQSKLAAFGPDRERT